MKPKIKLLTLDEFCNIKQGMTEELEKEYADDSPVDENIVMDKINSMIEEAFFNEDLLSDIVGEFTQNRKSGLLADMTMDPIGMLLDSLLTIITCARQPVYTICEIKFINATGDFIIKIK